MRISDWSSDVCSSDLSIHARSKDIVVPDLNDEQLILKGAGQYAAMCTQCHLKPGMKDSELRQGLYPLPPNLSQVRVDPKDAFWIIKHGKIGRASCRERVCQYV